ncbi:MAG: hypothetical protein AAGB34_07955 [Planctomycetota bacterium]
MQTEAAHDSQTRVLLGIDEAGYGPLLGPLTVASSAWRVPASFDEGADLWDHLSPVVVRTRREVGKHVDRVAIADSKVLKLPRTVKTQHELVHLERGVWAALSCAGERDLSSDAGLMEALGVDLAELERQPWYGGEKASLPVGSSVDQLSLVSARFVSACERAGVRPIELRCVALPEWRFNEMLGSLGVKSRVSFRVVGSLLARLWCSRAAVASVPPIALIDRQGGRLRYAQALAGALDDAVVEAVEESEIRSVYSVHTADGARQMRVVFQAKGDNAHLPIALASMGAKLVRELLMMRFNAYWCGVVEGLRPTAGYTTDGRRWLDDAGEAVTDQRRRELVRRA